MPEQRARLVGHGYLVDHVFRLLRLRDGARGRVATVKVAIVAVVGGEPDIAVGPRPFVGVHRGVKVSCQGLDLASGNVQGVELVVVHVGHAALGHVLPHSAETLRRAHYGYLLAVGRELRACHEAVVLNKALGLQRLQVHAPDGEERRGACGEPAARGDEQHALAVGTDVEQRHVAEAERQGLHHARLYVEERERRAVAPSRLAVIGLHHLEHVLVFHGALVVVREDDGLAIGRHLPTVATWQVGHHGLAAVGHGCPHELAVAVVGHALAEQVVGAGIEPHAFVAHAQHPARGHLPQRPRPHYPAAVVGVVAAGDGIAAVGREAKPTVSLAHEHVFQRVDTLRAWLKDVERGVVVGGDGDLGLRDFATQKGADLNTVGAWLEGQVAIALGSVHEELAAFQARHRELGLGVHCGLHVERERRQGLIRPQLLP